VITGFDDFPATFAVLQARALNGLFEGDFDAVRSAASEGAHLARQVGDLYTLQVMLLDLGGAALNASDLDEAKAVHRGLANRLADR
jgi:hypothetical protein